MGNAHPPAERALWVGLVGDAGPHGAPQSAGLSPASGRRSLGGPRGTRRHEPRSLHLAEGGPQPSGEGGQGAGGLGMGPDQQLMVMPHPQPPPKKSHPRDGVALHQTIPPPFLRGTPLEYSSQAPLQLVIIRYDLANRRRAEGAAGNVQTWLTRPSCTILQVPAPTCQGMSPKPWWKEEPQDGKSPDPDRFLELRTPHSSTTS